MEIAHARAAEVKSAANSTTKRRKLDAGELVQSSSSSFDNLSKCSCLINSPENSKSPVRNSASSDQSPADMPCSHELCDNSSRSAHLQVTIFKRELRLDAMETTTKRTTKSKASSAQQPSMAEIEEFFSVAEKYEAKRFAEKYNFDIVKDVPLEGKYQWVRIKQ
ncbi:hypothetical protein DCAR_0624135 [Daucus carota subsp. sativus]|uniref:Cyclin-dependent kinase inhibitor domain-containing protein n=1 Tax=Daucus carota subsp. sativus TaxID=79200 RepID=A0AAF0XB87_DAUCS|nr:hypothetical protein DCAR_0624135 [Daucus carota subsp. sativus]